MISLIKDCHMAAALFLLLMGTVTCAPKADVDEKVRMALQEKQRATVLVQLREQSLAKHAAPAERLQQIQRLQEAVLSTLTAEDFQLRYCYQTVAGFSGVLFESGLQKLLAHPEVEKITLDESGQGGMLESVPAINADIAYSLGFTGEGVTVGVLDSGVDLNHPDLKDDIVYQYHFLNAIEALNQVTRVDEPAERLPQTFTLEQNFPNPLRSAAAAEATAIIRYALPQPAMVTLSIFNLVGQEVKKLIQRQQSAGVHQITFDSRALAPGVNFYSLQAGSWRQTRKLVVVR